MTYLVPVQVENVLRGKTADGFARDFRRPRYTREDHRDNVLIAAVRQFMRLADQFVVRPDEARTAAIWKIADYAGQFDFSGNSSHGAANDMMRAAAFMAESPETVRSRIGLGGIVRLAGEADRRCRRQTERALRNERTRMFVPDDTVRELETLCAIWPEPPLHTVWMSADAQSSIRQLVHPLHLAREGMAAGNCLCKPHVRPSGGALRGLNLPNMHYWRRIEEQGEKIFTLRFGEMRLATVRTGSGILLEWQVTPRMQNVENAACHRLFEMLEPLGIISGLGSYVRNQLDELLVPRRTKH